MVDAMTSPTPPVPESEPDTAQPALLRHILPVAAGGAIALMLTVVSDNTLGAHGMLPADGGAPLTTGALLLIAAYRGLFAVLGCHVAARLAPEGQPRIRYALALGILMLILNLMGAISNWETVPRWYLLGSIAMTIPYAIIGGGTAVRAIAMGRERAER